MTSLPSPSMPQPPSAGLSRAGDGRPVHPVVVAHAQILILASPQKVWQLLTEVREWPTWNRSVASVHGASYATSGQAFRWKSQGFTVTSTPVAMVSHERLVWTGKAFGTAAWHAWELVPVEAGVLVRTEETLDGWLPRLLPGMMQGMLESALSAWLQALKQRAEAPGT